MFRGDGQSVEENQEDDQPIEKLGFDPCPALPPTQPVPPPRVSTEGEEAEVERCARKGERRGGEKEGRGKESRDADKGVLGPREKEGKK